MDPAERPVVLWLTRAGPGRGGADRHRGRGLAQVLQAAAPTPGRCGGTVGVAPVASPATWDGPRRPRSRGTLGHATLLPVRTTTTIRSVAAAAVLAVVATACGGSAYAARVNGTTVSAGRLQEELRSIAANEAYLRSVEGRVQVLGSGQGTFDSAFTAQVLTRQIVYTLVEDELAARDLTVTTADLEAARPRVAEQVGGEDILSAFSPEYQSTLVSRAAMVDVLTVALGDLGTGDDAARAYYEAHPDEFRTACVSHILTGDAQAAAAAKARLDAGEPFATVALEMSKDTQSAIRGGELGCDITPDTEFVPEFLDAVFSQPVDAVGDPVETAFGFHVIKVTSRQVPPFEDVVDRARAKAVEAGQELLTTWVGQAVEAASIDVNPRYGTFRKDGAQSTVVPPQAPTTPPAETSPAEVAPPDAGPGGPAETAP